MNTTETFRSKDLNDTSTSNNNGPAVTPYNRKVWRYAKKHKITLEQSFKKLYK